MASRISRCSQVALNDTIMVVAFAPIVGLLLGLSSIVVPWDDAVSVGRALHRDAGDRGAAVAAARCCAAAARRRWPRTLRRLQPVSLVALLRDPGPAVRLPGRADRAPAAGHPAAGGADHHPGLSQRRPRLWAQPRARRRAHNRRVPVGADRRVELLRAGGRRRHRAVRLPVRRGAGDRGRRAGRGAGDAVGRPARAARAGAGTSAALDPASRRNRRVPPRGCPQPRDAFCHRIAERGAAWPANAR